MTVAPVATLKVAPPLNVPPAKVSEPASISATPLLLRVTATSVSPVSPDLTIVPWLFRVLLLWSLSQLKLVAMFKVAPGRLSKALPFR